MSDRPETPLLDIVNDPADLRKLKPEQLHQLADELRAEMISADVLEKRMSLKTRLATHRHKDVMPHWMKNPSRLSNIFYLR
jgi:ribosomal protein L29